MATNKPVTAAQLQKRWEQYCNGDTKIRKCFRGTLIRTFENANRYGDPEVFVVRGEEVIAVSKENPISPEFGDRIFFFYSQPTRLPSNTLPPEYVNRIPDARQWEFVPDVVSRPGGGGGNPW